MRMNVTNLEEGTPAFNLHSKVLKFETLTYTASGYYRKVSAEEPRYHGRCHVHRLRQVNARVARCSEGTRRIISREMPTLLPCGRSLAHFREKPLTSAQRCGPSPSL